MSKTLQVQPGDRLTFRGCMWDAHWEFDAPCVIYSPIKRYGFGGNSGRIDHMVDSACQGLSDGAALATGWDEFTLREFAWRGWWSRWFAWRRKAWHVEIVVEFYMDAEHGVLWRTVSRRERYGLNGPWEEGNDD